MRRDDLLGDDRLAKVYGKELHPAVNIAPKSPAEIVYPDDFVTGRQQPIGHLAADEARVPRDQHPHGP